MGETIPARNGEQQHVIKRIEDEKWRMIVRESLDDYRMMYLGAQEVEAMKKAGAKDVKFACADSRNQIVIW